MPVSSFLTVTALVFAPVLFASIPFAKALSVQRDGHATPALGPKINEIIREIEASPLIERANELLDTATPLLEKSQLGAITGAVAEQVLTGSKLKAAIGGYQGYVAQRALIKDIEENHENVAKAAAFALAESYLRSRELGKKGAVLGALNGYAEASKIQDMIETGTLEDKAVGFASAAVAAKKAFAAHGIPGAVVGGVGAYTMGSAIERLAADAKERDEPMEPSIDDLSTLLGGGLALKDSMTAFPVRQQSAKKHQSAAEKDKAAAEKDKAAAEKDKSASEKDQSAAEKDKLVAVGHADHNKTLTMMWQS